MLPLRDDIRAERPPVINGLIILANVAVFLGMVFLLPDPRDQIEFVQRWGLVPKTVRAGLAHPSLFLDAPWPFTRDCLLPFVTSLFLHGGWAHLIGNMWFLFVFGDNVEGRFGHGRYLVFYLVCGIVAAALQVASVPAHAQFAATHVGRAVDPLEMPTIGASGAIAGVLGAYVVHFPRARVLTFFPIFWFFEVSAIVFLGFWFVMQFFMAHYSTLPGAESGRGPGIAYWAHVGGFVAGVLIALAVPRTRRTSWS